MGAITKAFKSGNSVAVRLPKELGITEGMELEVERAGDTVTITPARKKTLGDLVDALSRLPKPTAPMKRERIIFPKRNWR